MNKSYLAIYKTRSFYIGTYDLNQFTVFLYEDGIKILQIHLSKIEYVKDLIKNANVIYINKKELRKQKLTFEDIYQLTY